MDKKTPAVMGRPRAFQDAGVLKSLIQEYIDTWKAEKRPLTMAGMISFLDICDDTFGNYKSGMYDDDSFSDTYPDNEKNGTFSETIKKARKFVEADKLEQGLMGNLNPTVTIFDLKNNHGYADKIENKSDVNMNGSHTHYIDPDEKEQLEAHINDIVEDGSD